MQIASTARLLENIASKVKNKEATEKICVSFSKFLEDTFERKAQIGKTPKVTKNEIINFYKEQFPNFNLKIKRGKKPNVAALFDPTETKIIGYEATLPLSLFGNSIKRSAPQKVGDTVHEMTHVIKDGVETSTTAHIFLGNMGASKDLKQLKFYNNMLYGNEIEYLSVMEERFVPSEPLARKNAIKNEIIGFFKENNFTTENRIETLQNWRGRLEGEIEAFTNGIAEATKYKFPIEELKLKLINNKDFSLVDKGLLFDSQKEQKLEAKISGLAQFIKKSEKNKSDSLIRDIFFLSEKKEIVEQTMAEEMLKAGHDVRAWAVKNK